MKHGNRWILWILMLLVVPISVACGSTMASTSETTELPAVVEAIGDGFNRLTLTERAVERLDVQTAPVREESIDGARRLVIPYSAVIYDLDGQTWAYVSPEPRVFVRESITVDFIDGDIAVLDAGPGTGTEIATVAVQLLYGIDTGVGK